MAGDLPRLKDPLPPKGHHEDLIELETLLSHQVPDGLPGLADLGGQFLHQEVQARPT